MPAFTDLEGGCRVGVCVEIVPHSSYHTSFILRCWTNTSEQVRARLIDVRSGQSYLVARLAGLPELVYKLLKQDLSVPANSPDWRPGGWTPA